MVLAPDFTNAPYYGEDKDDDERGCFRSVSGIEDEHTGWIATDERFVQEPLTEHLTARETVVLRLMASGLGNKEIASRLDISEHTVKFHVSSVLAKLGAASRTEAVTIGIVRGLVAV
jgi:DNA-binding NarL/FixJ family response regulator